MQPVLVVDLCDEAIDAATGVSDVRVAPQPSVPTDGYLTEENAVGARIWLTILAMIWPSA